MAATHLHLAEYTEDERALASQRFSVIRPFFEDGVPVAHLARQHGLGVRTIQRWVHEYQQFGFVGLIRRRRSDRGHSRNLPPDLQRLIEGLALQTPAPSIAHIHRQITCDLRP